MKKVIKQLGILVLIFLSICSWAQNSNVTFEETETFFPSEDILNNDNTEWGFFTVPEDWSAPEGRKIKLAVAILRNHAKTKDTNPIVMIDGGPGAGSVEGIWWFRNHPLRKKHDVYLIDARGTGFSSPRLCPDLGDEFMKILAKNQSPSQDEKDKVEAAMTCKQQLIGQGINVNAYHSKNIAKDLHAAKEYFNYSNWNVYGVSYGTYVAQVYANEFPSDVKTLVLDSPISDISTYYTSNTSNYVSSLNKVFKTCKEDPNCNSEYPDLEDNYYKVIEDLIISPITVEVDKSIVEEGTFTYNAEDYKVAIHQALYQRRLIEVLPLLISQFRDRNEDALSALVSAFSGALGLDYGMYYCVTCSETIPRNAIKDYDDDANKFPRLKGGLSFYNSDFAVCNKWNNRNSKGQIAKDTLSKINIPTLIFTGKYDPITPQRNGDSLSVYIENSSLVNAKTLGHASSFTRQGFNLSNKFIDNPNIQLSSEDLPKNKLSYVKDIYVNGGVSKLGNSLNSFDILFFAPLIIALLLLIVSIFVFIIGLIRNRKKTKLLDKIIRILLIISSAIGVGVLTCLILAITETSSSNFYILAVGIPEQFSYLFTVLYVFFGLVLISSIYFILNVNKIDNRSVIFTILFSNILLGGYFLYWGLLPLF